MQDTRYELRVFAASSFDETDEALHFTAESGIGLEIEIGCCEVTSQGFSGDVEQRGGRPLKVAKIAQDVGNQLPLRGSDRRLLGIAVAELFDFQPDGRLVGTDVAPFLVEVRRFSMV